jgi:Arc/MetJ family transcription regulator
VYRGVVSRTNIDIDDELIEAVMERFGFKTKREAVNHALRELYVEPMTREEMLEMEGVGWDGDLDAMRGRATADLPAS